MTKTKKQVAGIFLFTIVLPLVTLAACSPTDTAGADVLETNITEHYQLPAELKDCKVFRLAPSKSLPGYGNMPWLYVVKCGDQTDTHWKQGTFSMQVSST